MSHSGSSGSLSGLVTAGLQPAPALVGGGGGPGGMGMVMGVRQVRERKEKRNREEVIYVCIYICIHA